MHMLDVIYPAVSLGFLVCFFIFDQVRTVKKSPISYLALSLLWPLTAIFLILTIFITVLISTIFDNTEFGISISENDE